MIFRSSKFMFLLIPIVLFSCVDTSNKSKSSSTNDDKKEATTYKIQGNDVVLREGPGEEYDKLVNEKATKMLSETRYVQVGESFKVKVVEEKNGWSKIETIQPKHLASSHNGWIKNEYVIPKNGKESTSKSINPSDYEVFKTDQKPSVTNYYVLLKIEEFNKTSIEQFMKGFRNEHCDSKCNIHLYDTKELMHLVSKYPLEDSEYLKVADHYIAMSTFDAPDLVFMYPFQDAHYKEIGGKNWKKDKPN